jgi:hypothetical protein
VSQLPRAVALTPRDLASIWTSTPPELFNELHDRSSGWHPDAQANDMLGGMGELFAFYYLKYTLEPPTLVSFTNRNQLLEFRTTEDRNPIDISFRHNGVFVHVCVKTSTGETYRRSTEPSLRIQETLLAMPNPTIVIHFQLKNMSIDNEFFGPRSYFKIKVFRNF